MNKKGSIHNKIGIFKAWGYAFASAALLTALASCSPSYEGQVTATQMPTASPVETVASVQTAAPTATPVPVVTPEPAPVYTFIGKAYCSAKESVNIRTEANTESDVKGTFPSGEAADIIEYSGGWAHLVYSGIEGYVNQKYLLKIDPPSVPIPEGDWTSIVVNPTHRIPGDYKVSAVDFKNGKVNERILKVCKQMFADAKKDGVSLKLVDAYRSYNRQKYLYERGVRRQIAKGYSRAKAEKIAATITARPGTSEHHTGLALDIVTPSYTKMDKGFAKTAAFKWLYKHAYNYGFTLRYPADKKAITKIIYEPWHWRFVGVKAAAQMKISGECLEEYFDITD